MAFKSLSNSNVVSKSGPPRNAGSPTPSMSVHDLFFELVALGYRFCKPRAPTWKAAFIYRRENSVLCVLFRKNGIDFRLYENYGGEVQISQDNFVAMKGGEIFRNHFNQSKNLITKKAAIISSHFVKGTVVDEIRVNDGRSYLLNPKYPKIRQEARERFAEERERLRDAKDWKDICSYVRDDCGGYWGDGAWM